MLKLLDLPDVGDWSAGTVLPGWAASEIDVSVLDGRGVEHLLRELQSCQAQLDGLRTRAVQRLRELAGAVRGGAAGGGAAASGGDDQPGGAGAGGAGAGGGRDVADRAAAAGGQSRAQARITERQAQARAALALAAAALDRGEITLGHFDALAGADRVIVVEHLDELVETACSAFRPVQPARRERARVPERRLGARPVGDRPQRSQRAQRVRVGCRSRR